MDLLLKKTETELVEMFFSLKKGEDVADMLEVPYQIMIYHIYRVPGFLKYKVFEIPKRSGGQRKICAPVTTLKILQKKLAYILKNVYRTKPSVHGFVDHRSIVTNAITHCKKCIILNVDIRDFFPSINFGRVRGMFMAIPYNLNNKVATILAQICCFNNQLPQGAPTSPIVSNMICAKMDSELHKLSRRYKCIYTRYADDITISSVSHKFPSALAKKGAKPKEADLGQSLIDVIEKNGFKINFAKVSFLQKYYRQEVTGLTVNQFPNIRKRYISQIRAMLHAWEKYGLVNAEKEFIETYDQKHRSPYIKKYWESDSKNKSIFREVIIGKLNYIRMVRGNKFPVYLKFCGQLARLDDKFEKVYQKILAQSKVNEYEDSVFVLEALDQDDIPINQATAFFLEGIVFVSCLHTLADNSKIHIFKSYNPDDCYTLNIKKKTDVYKDIMIIEATEKLAPACLHKGDSDKIKSGDKIKVIGFPNYAPGSTIQIYEGKVTGFKERFGFKRIIVDAAIICGNSGGPVLNEKNEVIGIAATGKDKHEDYSQNVEYGVIPIKLIDNL